MKPSPKDREREHETNMPHCWCNPRKIVYPNGNMAILHNYSNNQMENIEKKLRNCEMDGFITGMDRSVQWTDSLVAHIFKGTFHNPEYGMCKRANKNGGFSIFRNNVGRKGICKICLRNVLKEINNKPDAQ